MGEEHLKELPLKSLHEKAGAKFGGFAGWNMPITYPLGVLKEHQHCRAKAGMFDISHMQLFELEGDKADAAISSICPVDVSLIEPGESKYSMLLNEDGGIVDDLIITRYGPDRWIIVSNASRAAIDEVHFRKHAKANSCAVRALERVFLAVQGPAAFAAVKATGLDVDGLIFMHGKELPGDIIITRSGYTGEDGCEIAVPAKAAKALAEKLLDNPDVEWIGLAARDSLRLEAGLCLYGNDLDEATSPVDAGLMWAIPKSVRSSGKFQGAAALEKAIAAGPTRKRIGIRAEGRMPVRDHTPISDSDGNEIGLVTSGGFGPTVGHPVAMGYVTKSALDAGTKLFATVRGNQIPLTVSPLPFTPHNYVKG